MIILLWSIGNLVCIMNKKKRELVEAVVSFRNDGWTVKVNDKKIGRTDSLAKATDLLYVNGYKVYCYRRGETSSGKPKFTAACLVFDYDKENG